jgi:hypothetical protein
MCVGLPHNYRRVALGCAIPEHRYIIAIKSRAIVKDENIIKEEYCQADCSGNEAENVIHYVGLDSAREQFPILCL